MRNVGIFAPGAHGDIATVSSLLTHRNRLWPDCRVVWFVDYKYRDMLAHNPLVDEVRLWDETRHVKLRDERNRFLPVAAQNWDDTKDISVGVFPLPRFWPDIGKWMFIHDIPRDGMPFYVWDEHWHPNVFWTMQEEAAAMAFIAALPKRLTVMLETVAGSKQSAWDDETTQMVLDLIRRVTPCSFIFASKCGPGRFASQSVYDASAFTVRQLVPVFNCCHIFVGCGGGISATTCCWYANPKIPRINYIVDALYNTGETSRGLALDVYRPQQFEAAILRVLNLLGV